MSLHGPSHNATYLWGDFRWTSISQAINSMRRERQSVHHIVSTCAGFKTQPRNWLAFLPLKVRIYSSVAPPLLWARGHHDHQNMAEVTRCQFLGWGLKGLAVPLTWTLPLGTQQHAVRKSGHVTRPRACVLAESPSWSPNSQHPLPSVRVRNPSGWIQLCCHLKCTHMGDHKQGPPPNHER